MMKTNLRGGDGDEEEEEEGTPIYLTVSQVKLRELSICNTEQLSLDSDKHMKIIWLRSQLSLR